MILIFIFGVALLQYFLNVWNSKSKTKIPKFIIVLLFLIGHFFVFPQWFFPEPDPKGINCGMPMLGITLGFWIYGSLQVVLTQLFFSFRKKRTHS